MGIPLDVFSLYELRGAGCRHYLLTRVGRAGYSNADEREHEEASRAADRSRDALVALYESRVLAAECAAAHAAHLAGELQSAPAGDGVLEGGGGCYVELWVAETRHGPPWVVLGTAGDEEEFWRAVALDEDLSALGARRPARRLRPYFLAADARG